MVTFLCLLLYYARPTHEQFYDGLWTITAKDGTIYHHMKIRTPKIPGVEAQTVDGKNIYIREYSVMEKE